MELLSPVTDRLGKKEGGGRLEPRPANSHEKGGGLDYKGGAKIFVDVLIIKTTAYPQGVVKNAHLRGVIRASKGRSCWLGAIYEDLPRRLRTSRTLSGVEET